MTALDRLADAAARNPRSETDLAALAQALGSSNMPGILDHCLDRLEEGNPDGDAIRRLGLALLARGDPASAARCLQRAADIDQENPALLGELGGALLECGDPGAALEAFHEAVALAPDSAEARNNLGVAFTQRGRLAEAENCFRRALGLRGAFALAWFNLGKALRRQEKLSEAIAAFQRAIQEDPALARAYDELAVAYAHEGRREQALDCLARRRALDPGDPNTLWRTCIANLPPVYATPDEIGQCRRAYTEGLAELERIDLTAMTPHAIESMVGVSQPFHLAYQNRNDRELQARYGALAVRAMEAWRRGAGITDDVQPQTARGRRLRVGIVSAYFRHHSVWQTLIRGMLEGLPPDRFELTGYYSDPERDAATELAAKRLRRLVQAPLALRDWVGAIREDRPDVLLYPEIGMDTVTTQLAGLRLAPVQVASWGHPETSGLGTIDCFLSAEAFEPPDAAAHYSERLLKLPGLGCRFYPLAQPPKKVKLRELGVPDGGAVRFISCQLLFKYLPLHDGLYARIARAAGPCRFIFVADPVPHKTGIFRERLRRSFTAHSLDFDNYVSFVPQQPFPQFLGLLGASDVYLDAPGFSGFNTAMYAVAAGLPVVTLEGEFMRGRLAAGILRQLGAAETIGTSEEDYVRIAANLANDAKLRKAVASKARSGLPGLDKDNRPMTALAKELERLCGRD